MIFLLVYTHQYNEHCVLNLLNLTVTSSLATVIIFKIQTRGLDAAIVLSEYHALHNPTKHAMLQMQAAARQRVHHPAVQPCCLCALHH